MWTSLGKTMLSVPPTPPPLSTVKSPSEKRKDKTYTGTKKKNKNKIKNKKTPRKKDLFF